MTTRVRAGTSGYSYREWRGRFYPRDVHQDEWLGYYGNRLPTVEINHTFYRMPRSDVVETWRDCVSDDFRFVLKASRRITHQNPLEDVQEPLGHLLNRADILGGKLGALLFQMPPYLSADLQRLERFQALLPADVPVVFEFQHDSWNQPSIDEALDRRGHARVISHERGAPPPVTSSGLVYLRLRSTAYSETELAAWHERIVASGADQAYVFFRHEVDAGGPDLAERFLALAASPRNVPSRAPKATSGRSPTAGRRERR